MFAQEVFDWVLLIVRWVHITVAATWIGTSIFFMWLDRSLIKNPANEREGHVGDLWMVHGGGFYKVEKMLMGPTQVPETLHWFKWESYWTWMSGFILLLLTYYTGGGTYLIDSSVAGLSFQQASLIGLGSIFVSWFFYDRLWESSIVRAIPALGHALTILYFIGVTIFLCKTLAGRAAYIHVGAMMGTWMAGNVFMRIIPRQLKMVEATKSGREVNQEWARNAKNRSTHNTYFTLPVIFVMLSNHFPATYGNEYNWFCLLLITLGGGFIRQYFVIRLSRPPVAKVYAYFGLVFLILAAVVTNQADPFAGYSQNHSHSSTQARPIQTKTLQQLETRQQVSESDTPAASDMAIETQKLRVMKGQVFYRGEVPRGKKLRLPAACARQFSGDVYSDEMKVKDQKLANVFVRVVSGPIPPEVSWPAPAGAAVLDQKGCIYQPRVIATQVGQPVTFVNSDPVFHNVKGRTQKNPSFNLLMPKKNQRITRTFFHPEIMMQTMCSVHPWMSSYIAVVDHPYFAVTNEQGYFELPKLPSGEFELEFWHEVLGILKRKVRIQSEKENPLLTIEYSKAK